MLNPVRNTKAKELENKISNGVKGFLNRLLNILHPRICLVCLGGLKDNGIDNLLCFNCWSRIKKNIPPLCAICGRQIREMHASSGRVCHNCQRQNFSFDRALSPCLYEGVIRELIHKYKYQNKDYLSSLLAKLLIEFIYQYRISLDLFDLVMPIPLHKIKLREREFNQAELIARQIAKEFCLDLVSTNLWRKHNRKAQMELSKEKRWENIQGCFALHNPVQVKGKNILLVDDTLTTGATCSEAAAVLKAAGAVSIFILTLAN